MSTRPRFSLLVEALPRETDRTDKGAIVRFRRAVKCLGRAFGLKVLTYSTEPVTVETVTTGPSMEASDDAR